MIESSHRQRTPIKWCCWSRACARAHPLSLNSFYNFSLVNFAIAFTFSTGGVTFYFSLDLVFFWQLTFEQRQRHTRKEWERERDIHVCDRYHSVYSVQSLFKLRHMPLLYTSYHMDVLLNVWGVSVFCNKDCNMYLYVHLFRVCMMVLANATIWLPFISRGEKK